MTPFVATLLDILILCFLAGTVFYAVRLSTQLAVLKDSKAELEQLVSNLAINISRAHEAIQEMQEVASSANADLEGAIEAGQALSQELQLMTESGDRLAARLEMAATQKHQPSQNNARAQRSEKNRRAAEQYQSRSATNDAYYNDDDTDQDLDDLDPFAQHLEAETKQNRSRRDDKKRNVENFFIRDRDYENDDSDARDDYEDTQSFEDEFRNLSSRAEKQLATALKRNRKFDA